MRLFGPAREGRGPKRKEGRLERTWVCRGGGSFGEGRGEGYLGASQDLLGKVTLELVRYQANGGEVFAEA